MKIPDTIGGIEHMLKLVEIQLKDASALRAKLIDRLYRLKSPEPVASSPSKRAKKGAETDSQGT